MIFPKPRKASDSILSGPAMRASVMGLHFVSGLLVGGTSGYFLDKWLGTGFLFVVFLFLGLGAAFLNLYRDARRLMQEQDAIDAGKTQDKD